MIKEISEFLHSFKTSIIEAEEIVSKYENQIEEFANKIKEESLDKEYEENFLTILGYSYRLEDVTQRVFYTFQEAVYAIDLDKLMKNDESLKLNSIVYILVLDVIIKEYNSKKVNEELKLKAKQTYQKIEDRKAKENKKYHMYQN